MRIAIIGAPGAGKSDLANRLAPYLKLHKVDNYIDKLEKKTGIAMGYLADFVPQLMCAAERIEAEYYQMQRYSEDYVLCGTTVESVAYIAIRAVDSLQYTEDKHAATARAQAAIDAATLLLEHWNYDHVLYLPLSQSHEDDWDKRLDRSIQEALAMLSIDHTPLTSDNHFTEALAAIDVPLSEDDL
jgi:hypothetical protein